MVKRDTGAPPAGPLLTGEDEGRGEGYAAYRPRGSRDWYANYTLAGRGYFIHGAGEQPLTRGHLFLTRPGTPHDYGAVREVRHWHNMWAHFVPRGDALAWLDWPTFTPGAMLLQIPADLQPVVLAQFREMHDFARRGIGRHEELGLNALERALLLADESNPRSAMSRHDPRIRRAIDHVLGHLSDPPSLAALAEIAGLSRSRFALLFEQQVGQPPGKFIEQHRLLRANRLLEYTRSSLQQIADDLGFSSPFYLSLRFKHYFGVSPRDFRRQRVERKPPP